MNKTLHAARITHRTGMGAFKKHPPAQSREDTPSPTYLRDLIQAKGMNPERSELADALLGHADPSEKPERARTAQRSELRLSLLHPTAIWDTDPSDNAEHD